MNSNTPNPYVGPRTFLENERDRFFGREREARDLLALVVSERLVVFYAQSGAGKSSLVNTCLIPDLRKRGYEIRTGRVAGEAPDGIQPDNIFVFNLLRSLTVDEKNPAPLASQTIGGFLAKHNTTSDSDKKAEAQSSVLIIDQFEEIFSTHHEEWGKRNDFFEQLAQSLEDDPYLSVVLVMREDYIASLDPYSSLVPSRFRRRYYMQRLERDAAMEAVLRPAAPLRSFAPGVAEKLVENLASIKVRMPDGTMENQPGQYVEPVQLQVVCYTLWENLPPDRVQITENDLRIVGDVNLSLEKFYDGRVRAVAREKNIPERSIREWFDDQLITSGGLRNMVLHDREQKSSGGLNNDVIQALQGDLVRAELRAGQIWYELSHDRLIEPVVNSNKKWFASKLNFFQQQATTWNERGRSEGLLLRGKELVDAEKWADANPNEITNIEVLFLNACRKARADAKEKALANKRIRSALRTSQVISGVAGLLLGLSIVFGYQSYQSQRATQMQILVNAAELEFRRDNKGTATLLAYQVLTNFGDHGETERALASIIHPMQEKVSVDSPFIRQVPVTVDSTDFSSDGKTLAAGYSDGIIILWDVATQRPIGEPLIGHNNHVTSVAFSPDDKILASGSWDNTIILWEVATHQAIGAPLIAHTNLVNHITFSPDGKTLASGSDDATIILWDVQTLQSIGSPLNSHTFDINFDINKVAFSPDGGILASASDGPTIILWDVITRLPIDPPLTTTQSGLATSLIFSPDGKTLISGHSAGEIYFWDIETHQPIGERFDPIPGNAESIINITFSTDDPVIAASTSRSVTLLDAKTFQPIRGSLTEYDDDTKASLSLSPDIKTIAIGGYQSDIVLWDVETRSQKGKTLQKQDRDATAVYFMSMYSDSHSLLAVDTDNNIILSDGNDQQILGQFPIQTNSNQAASVALSPDGKTLVTGDRDGYVRIINTETGKEIAQIYESGSGLLENNAIFSVAFSPDGRYLATGNLNGTAHVYNAMTGAEVTQIRHGIISLVTSVAFSKDGKYVISGSINSLTSGRTIIWEATSGKVIASISHDNSAVIAADINPDGTRIAVAMFDNRGTVEVWDVETRQRILTISNRAVDDLGLSTNSRLNAPPENSGGVEENRAYIMDVSYSEDALFILYPNGVIDQWTIWPSRAQLQQDAQIECGTCELTYKQRLEYKLYSWPMQVFNNRRYFIVLLHLILIGACIRLVNRSVFVKPGPRLKVEGFTRKKFLSAALQGGGLTLISLIIFVVFIAFELFYYGELIRLPSETDLWLLVLILPAGLWSGGAYAHFTHLQTGKLAKTKRSFLGMLSGFIGGSLAGFSTILMLYRATSDYFYFDNTTIPIGLIVGVLIGITSLCGALIYIFWLYPWSIRWRQQHQEMEEF